MNNVILIGRITKELELKYTPTKKSFCNFTLVINRMTKKGEKQNADFINCVVWNEQAKNLCVYQKKGSQLAVKGRIQTRNYDDATGKKIYITEILCENIQYLDSKKESDQTVNTNVDKIEINDLDLPF